MMAASSSCWRWHDGSGVPDARLGPSQKPVAIKPRWMLPWTPHLGGGKADPRRFPPPGRASRQRRSCGGGRRGGAGHPREDPGRLPCCISRGRNRHGQRLLPALARPKPGTRRRTNRDGGRRHRHQCGYCRSHPRRSRRAHAIPPQWLRSIVSSPPAAEVRHFTSSPHRVLAGRRPKGWPRNCWVGITGARRQRQEKRPVKPADFLP